MQAQWKKSTSWTVFLGHLGAAFLVFGITGAGLWSQQAEKFVAVGEVLPIAAYTAVYMGDEPVETSNYSAKRAHVVLFKGKQQVAELMPEYRSYKIREQKTSESAIYSTPAFDVYAVIGEASEDGRKTALRMYYKPTMSFIWSGCLLMMLGGLLVVWHSIRKKQREVQ
jgi:cytochrome c-type biogenesis protein CcmF